MKLEQSVDNLERLMEAARGHHSKGDLGRARMAFEEALAVACALGDHAAEADLLRNLGTVHRQLGDLPEGHRYYEQSLQIAESANLPSAITSALNCLGILTQLRGDVELATDYYRRARSIAESTGDDLRVAMVDQNLATLAQIRGRFSEAVESYMSAQARFRTIGNHQLTASVLNNLGFVHIELQQWVDAENCLDDAFVLAHELRDAALLGMIELNRANLNIKQNSFERARECCDQAFEINTRAENRGGIADTYVAYGKLFRAMQRPNLALAHLEKAVDVARSCEERLPEAEAFQNLALVHLGEGRNADALSCLNTAHNLFRSLQASTALSELDHRLDGLEETYLAVVEQWAESIEAKDRYTAGHCGRVADYAVRLAAASGFKGRDLTWFRMGGFLHDVGKTGVPLEILNKPGKLTDEEFLLMQSHTTMGDDIVAPLNFPWDIRPLVRSHHEKWDGTGYPDRLKGEEIPFAARILCVADVYDALTSARSYRPALSQAEAFKIMDRESGTTLDPVLYARFRELMLQSVPIRSPDYFPQAHGSAQRLRVVA
jgi:HD-GYP domain-containing protein (c-di-GMP phosphodiesterase class II)